MPLLTFYKIPGKLLIQNLHKFLISRQLLNKYFNIAQRSKDVSWMLNNYNDLIQNQWSKSNFKKFKE